MAVNAESHARLDDEFALVADAAAEVGAALPRVRRSWVNVPAGGHVSAVFWGEGPPELVLLHDAGESARAWDAVALAVGRPAVAIDLPGHGRSDWRRDGRYEPAKLAPAVAEAIRSFAPRARLVAGTGLGGRTALALRRRQPRLVPRLALVGVLPGAASVSAWQWSGPERFASPADALAVLTARHPLIGQDALRRQIRYELAEDPDDSWSWRHHLGNLPPLDAEPVADEALWDALAQLGSAAALIHGAGPGSPTTADLDRLRERAPDAAILDVPGGGTDAGTTRAAALAAALDQLVTAETGTGPEEKR